METNSSVNETIAYDSKLLKPLAKAFNLTYHAFGTTLSEEGEPSKGTLTLSDAFHSAHGPSPVTPTGKDAAPYQLLSGTIKATYRSHRAIQGPDNIVVSPGMPSGNTGAFSQTKHPRIVTGNMLLQIHATMRAFPNISSVITTKTLATLRTDWLVYTESMSVSSS